ncbi:hypothetical protein GCM10022198_09830 [Klugiella xanthotipulae]|uniref:Uncharacterized protein DUF3499 n=1 Tax=Klugiella xanthotipulae TaxID=244735 RepID=A0A543HYH6_9MICO|nr:DUF3499 family protein [Klugiella xanthotipulae]TQM63381.1 uncharacterized protein DUF3499 [Klugiella xanthotipulae]
MRARLCSKAICGRPAAFTLTYDYAGCAMAIGPLSPTADPNSYDLCQIHSDRLTPPANWTLLRHTVFGGVEAAADPAPTQLV